jgi:hypothetical protein
MQYKEIIAVCYEIHTKYITYNYYYYYYYILIYCNWVCHPVAVVIYM